MSDRRSGRGLWAGVALAALLTLGMGGGAQAQSTPGPDQIDPCYDGGCGESGLDPFNRPVRVIFGAGGRYEFVTVGPAGDAEAVRAAILEVGGRIERESSLGALGQFSLVATFPSEAARQRAQELIAARTPRSALSPHHAYFYAQVGAPRLYAAGLIGDSAPGGCRVSRALTVGIIDGPVNAAHPALAGVDLRQDSLVPAGEVVDASHGTGVAALIAGQDDVGAVQGFAQGVRLHAVSVFGRGQDDVQTGVERIVQALDLLAASGVRLVNMSFAGPENAALANALEAAHARGMVMIAASGNNRRAEVAWPAAAPEVIAVTAVDAARRLFRMANTGAEIELSAPGVDVYTARASGASYVTGTSFAAPIVTALAAREMAAGIRSPEALRSRLRGRAEPLEGTGRSARFGFGLVQGGGC